MSKDDKVKIGLGNGTLGPLENGFPDPDKTVSIEDDLAEQNRKEKQIFRR